MPSTGPPSPATTPAHMSPISSCLLPCRDSGTQSIYPLGGPDLAKARALASGNLRSGKATLYVADLPLTIALGQVLKRNLDQIGLTVEIKPIPQPAYDATVNTPGEPFDMAFFVTPSVDYYDPYAFLNIYFESRFIGRTNSSNLRSPEFDRRLRTASTLSGAKRVKAYQQLDADLVRDAAPVVPLTYTSEPTLVSKRVGCVLLRPALDLAAACLKS